MKGTYVTIEIVLIAALMRFGEIVGTKNIWFVIVAIIISYFILELLYAIRKQSEKLKSNKPHTLHTSETITEVNKSVEDDTVSPYNTDTFKIDIS